MCSKAKKCEIQSRYYKLLKELEFLISGLDKVDFANVILAVMKSVHVDVEAEKITQTFENFKDYVTYISGKANGTLNVSQVLNYISCFVLV